MKPDGTKERVVFESPDLRKLQLTEDGVYYLGAAGGGERLVGREREFQVFFQAWDEIEAVNLMLTEAYDEIIRDEKKLIDFYVTDTGEILNVSYYWGVAEVLIDFFAYCVDDTSPKSYEDFSVWTDTLRGDSFDIAALEDLYFISDYLPINQGQSEQVGWSVFWGDPYKLVSGVFSITDKETNQVVYRSYKMKDFVHGTHPAIDSFRDDGVLMHWKNELRLMSQDFGDELKSCTLEGGEEIAFVLDAGEKAFIVTQSGEKQRVYMMDMELFTAQKMYECGEGTEFWGFETNTDEYVAWLDAEKMITAQGNTIKIWRLVDGQYKMEREHRMKRKVVQKGNQTEVAGDWLFFYSLDNVRNSDRLIETVYIGSE